MSEGTEVQFPTNHDTIADGIDGETGHIIRTLPDGKILVHVANWYMRVNHDDIMILE